MNKAFQALGSAIAHYLAKEIDISGTAPPTKPLHLQATLQAGDVLLVEGNTRISSAIKYLTQSTWSHAALYVGSNALSHSSKSGPSNGPLNRDLCLIEADTLHGVRAVGLEAFANHHTRICRPIGLSADEVSALTTFAINKLGNQYDLRNVFDLARYLIPTPPIPTRFRRQLLSLGSGSPTQAICSTLIAQAFQSIRYPILAHSENPDLLYNPPSSKPFKQRPPLPQPARFATKHFSLFTPRDFDVSPYFQIIKPTIEAGFDFHNLEWV